MQEAKIEPSFGVFGGTFDPPHIGHKMAVLAAQAQLKLERIYVVVANDPWQKSATGAVITPAEHRLAMCRATFVSPPGGIVGGGTVGGGIVGGGIVVSDCEIRRGGASHTFDTVTELLASNPTLASNALANNALASTPKPVPPGPMSSEPVLIVGADIAAGLDTWHRADELRELVTVAVLMREPPTVPVPAGWRGVPVSLDLSATVDATTVGVSSAPVGSTAKTGATKKGATTGELRIADVSSTYIRSQIAKLGIKEIENGLLAPAVADYIGSHGLYPQS